MKAFFLALLLAAHFLPALANPSAIYRCGSAYLNDAALAQARGCPVVEGSGVLVTVTGTRVQTQAAETSPVQARPASAGTPVASSVPPTKASPWRTDSAEQRLRDRDALGILQAELGKAEAMLAARQRELADPQRPATGLSELQSGISRHLSDIASLKREISRLPLQSQSQSK